MNDRKFSLRLVHGGASGNAAPDTQQVAAFSAAQAADAPPADLTAARIAAAFERAAKPEAPDPNFVVPATLLTQAEADYARKLILDYEYDGKSLRERLALAEKAITSGEGGLGSPYWETMQLCTRMGIVLSTGGQSFGLATTTYATVLENKNLVRYIPALKKLSKKLPGLPLY